MKKDLATRLIHIEFAVFGSTIVFVDGISFVSVPIDVFADFVNGELEEDDISSGCIDFEFESYLEMLGEPEISFMEAV